jgi:hypothetical protein
MKKYVTVYPFEVMDLMANGKSIFMLDREVNEVFSVSSISVDYLMRALKTDIASGQYDFWYEESVSEDA